MIEPCFPRFITDGNLFRVLRVKDKYILLRNVARLSSAHNIVEQRGVWFGDDEIGLRCLDMVLKFKLSISWVGTSPYSASCYDR